MGSFGEGGVVAASFPGSLRSVGTGRGEPWERGWGGGSDVAMFIFINLGYDNFLSTEKVAARLHRKL